MLTSNSDPSREAKVRFLDADIKLIMRGDYVKCAATDRKIPIEMLRYWSVDRQEAYYDAAASQLRASQLTGEDA